MKTITRIFSRYFLAPGTEINWFVLCTVLYFLSHLLSLTALPVFADEAIYIRWTQLIMDDPSRYAFFALNDGKTPLFIWLMLPFQYIFSDQLFAGRFVAVIVGYIQVLLTGALIRKLSGSRTSQMIGMLLVTFLPYWYFHHRMALMDGLLTLCCTGAVYGVLALQEAIATQESAKDTWLKQILRLFRPSVIGWTIGAAVCFGLALWSKLPAVLLAPALCLSIFYLPRPHFSHWISRLAPIGAVLAGGVAVFALLKLHPAFGQLFSRGGDFLYPLSEFLQGAWIISLQQIPNYFVYYANYLSAGLLLLLVFGLFIPHQKRRSVVLLVLMGLTFMGPIALLGKVVYARYLFPIAPFFTVAAALTIDSLLHWLKPESPARLRQQAQLVLLITGSLILITITPFIGTSLINPNATPFVESDKFQYLTEWSSGHGIKETTQLLQHETDDKRIAVATEGFFGTLPDGMLMYLHRENVDNLIVEGIGQPLIEIPPTFANKAQGYDEVWLVVNSSRMKLKLPPEDLKVEYCRPYAAACLQVWDITSTLPTITKK